MASTPINSGKPLAIGGRYNYKGQHECLVYKEYNFSGNGHWHQFEKVERPDKIWC